jgi:hypothetical protein
MLFFLKSSLFFGRDFSEIISFLTNPLSFVLWVLT